MIHMTLAETKEFIESSVHLYGQPTETFRGISIDTRDLKPGNLFVALPGKNNDGHDFIAAAHKAQAAAALVERKIELPLSQIIVKNSLNALQQLAYQWRTHFNLPIVAITGSNGKTTTKDMVASILATACNDPHAVLRTEGTRNNHLGVPLTLSLLSPQHRYAVIEMGMNHFGEIELLTKLAHPHIAVITNASACHLEGVGSLEGVARAKSEIFLGLHPQGMAILNRDDAFFSYWQSQIAQHRYITFGLHPEAHVTAFDQGDHYVLKTPIGIIDVKLPLLGQHNLLNMLAAAASAITLNVDLPAIQQGLEKVVASPRRLEMHTLQNNVSLIDDTHNANPLSLEAALNALRKFTGKKIFVLADMKELGAEAVSIHRQAGEMIRNAGVDYLFTYGDLSAHTSHSFGIEAYHFHEQEKLINALLPFLYNPITILIKGSRSMKMEKVVEALKVAHKNTLETETI